MTPQSQKIILTALREYKRENLIRARASRDKQSQFEECMAIDDQIELAMQEIVVAS